MAKLKYIPEFPYKKDQAIISSGRIIFHAKDDSVFIFGKKAVGISSVGVVNIDNFEGTMINSPKIELGLNAKEEGEPIMLGRTTNQLLLELLAELQYLGNSLTTLSKTGLTPSRVVINNAGEKLIEVSRRISENLKSQDNLSKISHTK